MPALSHQVLSSTEEHSSKSWDREVGRHTGKEILRHTGEHTEQVRIQALLLSN